MADRKLTVRKPLARTSLPSAAGLRTNGLIISLEIFQVARMCSVQSADSTLLRSTSAHSLSHCSSGITWEMAKSR